MISNFATDQSKLASQIVSGYAIRNGLAQKMAPGDRMFHVVSLKNKQNKMNNFKTRLDAVKEYLKLGNIPKIMMSGETGDILMSNGDQNSRD